MSDETKVRAFRKRPVVIQAQQWWPPGDERHDPSMLVHRKGTLVDPTDYRQVGDLYCAIPGGVPNIGGEAVYMIRTLEGNMNVSPGDWVIIGVKGEKYACKPDIFEQTYELATSPSALESELAEARADNAATEKLLRLHRRFHDAVACPGRDECTVCNAEYDLIDKPRPGASLLTELAAKDAEIERLREIIAAARQSLRTCEWQYDSDESTYHTSCGRAWSFTGGDGTIADNRVEWCHGCGGRIVTQPPTADGR